MIRYVRQAYIDRKKYDLCVKLDRSALLYPCSWYLDTVCESWDVLVLNDYDAVWPLPFRRKYGIKYFYRPFAVQQLGIFSKEGSAMEPVSEFVSEMKKNCFFADLYLNAGQNLPKDISRSIISQQRNYILDLQRPYSSIYNNYSSSIRKSLKTSGRRSWSIFEHDNPEILIEIFKKNKGASLALPDEFYRVFTKMMYACLHRNCGHLWTIYTEGNECCGGIFLTEFRGRLTFMFSALTAKGRKLRAMPYLLNEYIIYQSEKYRWFDFEGSNDENIAKFYAGFGAQEQHYLSLQYFRMPFLKRVV